MSRLPFGGDPLAFWEKLMIEDYRDNLLRQLQLPRIEYQSDQLDRPELSDVEEHPLPQLKVGILGAGISGLYTALILGSLDIEYEILEASDRIGGRISTYRFPRSRGEYDYFEEGAMRFPLPKKDGEGRYTNGVMKRLAELIEYGPLNNGPDTLKSKLIPFYASARDCSCPGFYYFNGKFEKIDPDKPKGDFNAQEMGVGPAYAKAGSKAIYTDVINPFVRHLINDYETGSKDGWALLKAHDSYSIRGYMATKYIPSDSLNLPPQHLPNNVINWCNLLETSSGGFDRALPAGVFAAMAFANIGNSKYAEIDWVCFEGGSETLTKRMEEYLKSRSSSIKTHKRVTAIRQDTMFASFPEQCATPHAMKVTCNATEIKMEFLESSRPRKTVAMPCMCVTANGSETKRYSHIISTLPPPVLRTIDLKEAGLDVMQRNALRGIDCGPAIKIAILFKSNWWTTKLGIVGGQSFTDLPIRNIVYPSYGVDAKTPSRVLIASYTSTTDAFRLCALSAKNERTVLKELVLRNLAEAHGHLDPCITYAYLCDEFEDMHVKDWNADQYSMGAFALFSPGQFEDLYASLNVPAADGRLHFAGEAISTRNGWVVGALDSAWKAVNGYLKVTGQKKKEAEFKKIWGGDPEWTVRSTMVKPNEHDTLNDSSIAC